jgi:hypothetical protein
MARDFPGSAGNKLSITNPTGSLDITGTALTLSAWIRPDVVGGGNFRCVIAKDASTGTTIQYRLLLDSSGHVRVSIGDSGGEDIATGGTVLSTGVWSHAAGRKSGTGAGALLAFLNGAQDGSATSNKTIQDTSGDFNIGGESDNAFPFDGRIAEVAVWNAALTAAEIAALAKGASPLMVRPKNLAAYYPLWGVGAAGEPDLSGNAQALTETGTVGVADHAPVGPYVAE